MHRVWLARSLSCLAPDRCFAGYLRTEWIDELALMANDGMLAELVEAAERELQKTADNSDDEDEFEKLATEVEEGASVHTDTAGLDITSGTVRPCNCSTHGSRCCHTAPSCPGRHERPAAPLLVLEDCAPPPPPSPS
eukprot:SAG31_NODE_409_length_16006_cov_10.345760_10_plen_137_part_00